jgi:hypothetical protein
VRTAQYQLPQLRPVPCPSEGYVPACLAPIALYRLAGRRWVHEKVVLDLLLAEVPVAERQFGPNFIVHLCGDADAAGLSEALEAGRDVDAVAVDLTAAGIRDRSGTNLPAPLLPQTKLAVDRTVPLQSALAELLQPSS